MGTVPDVGSFYLQSFYNVGDNKNNDSTITVERSKTFC